MGRGCGRDGVCRGCGREGLVRGCDREGVGIGCDKNGVGREGMLDTMDVAGVNSDCCCDIKFSLLD